MDYKYLKRILYWGGGGIMLGVVVEINIACLAVFIVVNNNSV